MGKGDTFGKRLNRLFAARQRKTGVELSLSKFIEDFKERTGVVLSKGYLSDLRNDLAPEPRLDLVRAIAQYFEVDPSYFLVTSARDAKEIEARGELTGALRAAGASELSFRTAGLSAESIRRIAQIIDNVRSLEGLPAIGDESAATSDEGRGV